MIINSQIILAKHISVAAMKSSTFKVGILVIDINLIILTSRNALRLFQTWEFSLVVIVSDTIACSKYRLHKLVEQRGKPML